MFKTHTPLSSYLHELMQIRMLNMFKQFVGLVLDSQLTLYYGR